MTADSTTYLLKSLQVILDTLKCVAILLHYGQYYYLL